MTITSSSPSTLQSPAIGKGILWILLAMFLFASMDAGVKHLVKSYSIVQVVWGRFFFHLLLLLVVFARRILSLVRTSNAGLQLLRSVLMVGTTSLFFTGLFYVPLADAASMMLVSPLIVTALSMPILKEPVGVRRWAGVFIGFTGAIIIIRPTGDLQLATLFPLFAAASYAIYQISTRFLSRADSVETTLFYTALIGALFTSIAVPFVWINPTPIDWLIMVFSGLCGGLGHFALIRALVVAPAAAVVPFSYTAIIWATAYGVFLFGNFPDQWTVLGATIIVASGLYVFFREQKKRYI